MLEPPRQVEIPTVLPLAPPPPHDSQESEMRGQGVHAKALKIRALERHTHGKPRTHRIHGFDTWKKLERCLLVRSRTRHELYLMSKTQSLVELDRFWVHIAKLVVVKRSEALNPRILVVCLGIEFCSVQES